MNSLQQPSSISKLLVAHHNHSFRNLRNSSDQFPNFQFPILIHEVRERWKRLATFHRIASCSRARCAPRMRIEHWELSIGQIPSYPARLNALRKDSMDI
jgi:hypothetical protein